jgi:hypothetical protein
MRVRLEWKPADLWIGAFIKRRRYHDSDTGEVGTMIDLWVCFVPTVPLHFTWFRPAREGADDR